jgi:hypothetical protein
MMRVDGTLVRHSDSDLNIKLLWGDAWLILSQVANWFAFSLNLRANTCGWQSLCFVAFACLQSEK